MPNQNITVPHRQFLDQCQRHDTVIAGLAQIDPKLQKLLAELVMMRLFDEFQEAIAGIALRLACGTAYADGSTPRLLTNAATSTVGAKHLFENHGRTKSKSAKWSKTTFINDTTKYVFGTTESFRVVCDQHSLIISEMQAVRNRIAHKNAGSRANFSTVVRRHYGADLNNITPGLFLLSSRFTPTKLEQYVSACRVISRSCSKA